MKRLLYIVFLFLLGFNAVQLVLQGEENFSFQGLNSFLQSLSSLDLDFSNILDLVYDFQARLNGINIHIGSVGDFFQWIANVFNLLFAPIELIIALVSDILDFLSSLLDVLSRLLAYSPSAPSSPSDIPPGGLPWLPVP